MPFSEKYKAISDAKSAIMAPENGDWSENSGAKVLLRRCRVEVIGGLRRCRVEGIGGGKTRS